MTMLINFVLVLLALLGLFFGLAEVAHRVFNEGRWNAYQQVLSLLFQFVSFVLLLYIAATSSLSLDGLAALSEQITGIKAACVAAGGQP